MVLRQVPDPSSVVPVPVPVLVPAEPVLTALLTLQCLFGNIVSKLPAKRGVNFFVRKGKTVEERFIGNAYMFTPSERKSLLKIKTSAPDPMSITKPFYDNVKSKDDVTKMQYLDLHLWMAKENAAADSAHHSDPEICVVERQ